MVKIDSNQARKLLNLGDATIVNIEGNTVVIRLRKYAIGKTYDVGDNEAAMIRAALAAGHYESAA